MTTRPPHLYEAAHAAYVDAEGRHGGGPVKFSIKEAR